MDTASDHGTVYAQLDFQKQRSLFTGVDANGNATAKIFAFSVLSESPVASDPLLSENQYLMETEEKDDEDYIAIQVGNASTSKLRDGERIHPSAPPRTTFSHEYRDSAGRLIQKFENQAVTSQDRPGFGDYFIDWMDDLPANVITGLHIAREISPVLGLILAVLGLFLGWHTGVCVLVLVMSYEAAKKSITCVFTRTRAGVRNNKIDRLSSVMDHKVLFHYLDKDNLNNGIPDTTRNFETYEQYAKLRWPEGINDPRAKEIKIRNTEVAKVMCAHPEEGPGKEEIAIGTSGNRAKIDISFFDGLFKRKGLVDTGAMSCVIDKKLIAEMRASGINIMKTNTTFAIQGVVDGNKARNLECVLLNINLGGKIDLRHVPFIVADTQEVIIGMNVIKACRLSTGFKGNGDMFIQIMNDNKLEELSVCLSHEDLDVISVCDVTVHPHSYGVLELEIPKVIALPKNNINKSNVLVQGNPEVLEDKDLFIIPTISRVNNGKVKVIFKNNTDHSFKVPGEIPIGMITDLEKEGLVPDKKDWINFGDYSKPSIGINSISQRWSPECPCKLRLESHVITLCDSSGYSRFRTCALSSSEEELMEGAFENGLVPNGIIVGPPRYKNGGRFITVTPTENGDYDYPLRLIEELIKDLRTVSETEVCTIMCDWEPFRLERSKAEFILKLRQACPNLSIVNTSDKTQWCEECTPFSKTMSNMIGLYRMKKVHVHFLTGSFYPSRDVTDSDIDHPVLRYKIMRSLIGIHIKDTTATLIVHIPGYSYFGSFGYLRRLMTLILKDLYYSRIGRQLTISGSNQENRARIEGFNMIIMKAFISAVSEFGSIDHFVWRNAGPDDMYIQEVAKMTEEVRILEVDCGCGFCRNLMNKRSPVVSKETILYDGSFKDFERIANEVKEMTNDTCNDHQVITIVGQASVTQEADADVIEFEAENHGEVSIGPFEDKLIPFPVMLDVPTEQEKEISREWRDYIDLKEVPEHLRKDFEKTLDRHQSIFAYWPNEVRFVKEDGKTAELDLEMISDKPLWTKPFGLAGPILEKLELKIEELLKAGLIEPIKSDWNSPVFMVPHNSAAKNESAEDRKYRMIVDLRVVNSMVKFSTRYSYLVKGIEFAMEKLRNKKYFTVLDMNKAYRSLKVSRKTQEICSFIVPNSIKWPTQSFAFKSVIDGLNLGPGYYSYLINKALSFESRKATMIHIDDVCIASETLEQHLKDIDNVMRDLNQSGFMIAAAKASFFQTETRFLGHRISLNQITIDENRKALFKEVPVPKTKKEMMRFLGMANYMGSFCDSFILRAGPLFDSLKGKKREYTLTPEQLTAFEEVKAMIDNAPALKIVDFSKPVVMEVDASYVGAGSVIYQTKIDETGKEIREVIRYGSKRFSVQQCLMYTSLEKESLAILFGIQQHSFFLGNSIDAIIRTDMKALICILSCYNNPTNQRMARVAHFLYSLPYSWQLTHIAGTDNIAADLLSRAIPDYRCAFSDRLRTFKDLNRESIKLPEEWTRTPNVKLTTADIMNNLKNNMLMEEASDRVMEKRINAFTKLGHDILGEEFVPSYDTSQKLREIEQNRLAAEAEKTTRVGAVPVKPYPVSMNYLVTTKFLSEQQNLDPFLNDVKVRLRAYGESSPVGKKLCKKYRLLNDTVLVTRADKNLPFEEAGNLRIVCTEKMALIILSYMHIFNSHAGFNAIVKMFNASYKVKGLIAFAKIVTSCCRSCKLETMNPNHVVPGGRIPLPNGPNDTWWVDHMVFGGELRLKGKKVNAAFNIVDGYSGILLSHLVPDQKVGTTIECFRKTFASMGVPRVIVSDNHKALNLNEQMRTFLRSQGVKNIVTTSPYRSQANKCERIHRTLRRGIRLAGETFGRSPLEMYHQIVLMVNSRPLTISDHPVVRKLIEKTERVVTPFDLHFGRPMGSNPMRDLLGTHGAGQSSDDAFQKKWKDLIRQLDEVKRDEIIEANEKFKRPPGYEIGDLVYLENNQRHKESLRFIRNLFVIMENKYKKFRLQPLFGNAASGQIQAHANDLKAYNYSHLLDILPIELKTLMGQNMSPEELKEKLRQDPKFIPDDLLPKNVIEKMHLRNRLSPRSVTSVPAILSSDTSYISDVYRFQGDSWNDDDMEEEIIFARGNQAPASVCSYPDSRIRGNSGHGSQASGSVKASERPQEMQGQNQTPKTPSDRLSKTVLSPIDGPTRFSETMKTERGNVSVNMDDVSPQERQPRSIFSDYPGYADFWRERGGKKHGAFGRTETPKKIGSPIQDAGARKMKTPEAIRPAEEDGRDQPEIVEIEKKKEDRQVQSAPEMREKIKSPKWVRRSLDKVKDLEKMAWWRKKGPKTDSNEALVPEVIAINDPPQEDPVEFAQDNDPPDVIVYEDKKRNKKKKTVKFDGISPEIKERITRAGRKTKVPARYQD